MNFLILILVILNSILILNFETISKKFKIEDRADGIRKFQKTPVPLLGGSFILINIIITYLFNYFYFDINLFDNFIYSNRELFAFTFGIISFYLFGLFDDKYKLSSNYKLLISTFLIVFFLLIDDNLLITTLEFSFLSRLIELKSFSFFFTTLCFLLFINALNMFDGINCQSGSYCNLIFLIFVFKGIIPEFCLIIILAISFFLLLNYKNKIYLGESGVLILAFIIGYIFIKASSNSYNYFLADEIFIIMALPGLDMFRLFILRLYSGKHPFSSDTNHIHHLILKHYTNTKTFIIIFIFILVTIILYFYIDFKLEYLISYIMLYFLIIFVLTKKIKN